jgi:hypothetical protein
MLSKLKITAASWIYRAYKQRFNIAPLYFCAYRAGEDQLKSSLVSQLSAERPTDLDRRCAISGLTRLEPFAANSVRLKINAGEVHAWMRRIALGHQFSPTRQSCSCG